MFSKVFFLLAVLQLIYYIHADMTNGSVNVSICTINIHKIQEQILSKISSRMQAYWNITPSTHNIQFFPVLEVIGDNMILIQIFYENKLFHYQQTHNFLETPYEIACVLNKLEQSSNVKLKFKNVIFYDDNLVNKQYLEDVITYYHSEPHKITITPNNTGSIMSSMNEWMSKNTKGRKAEKENSLIPGLTNFHNSAINYSTCWYYTKVVDKEPLLFTLGTHGHHRSRRFVGMGQVPTLNFDNITKNYVDTFSAMETVGYYNDTRLGFEAIRIPYKHKEFVMTILLPKQSNSLKMFINFTLNDYLEIFNRVNENHKKIHYVIPILNLDMVSINENGTTINSDGPTGCDMSSHFVSYNSNNIHYKPFIVDRPYGVFIYHENTKIVLWQAWIKDPTTDLFVPLKYLYSSRTLVDRNLRRVKMYHCPKTYNCSKFLSEF